MPSPMGAGSQLLGSDLSQTPVASVLISALKQKITGELSVQHEQGQDRIYFQNGIPTGTQVLRSFMPLGRFLLDLGWIDMAALERSIEMMAQGRRQGEALVEIGALQADQLERALRMLQIRNLVEMAKLARGELSFEAAKAPPPWACGVPPNALRTLREVLAVDQSAGVCDLLIDRIGGEHKQIRLPAHLLVNLKHLDLDDDEERAARLLIEPRTLASFWEFCQLSRPRARALAAELALTGLAVGYGLSEDTGQLRGEAESEERRKAAEARAGLDELGKTPQASVAHREDDRARRRKLLQRAISHNAPTGLARAFAGHKRDQPQPPAPVTPLAPPPPAGEAAAEGSALNDEERGLEALIRERTELLPRQDFFSRLGLNRSATGPQIKSAFVKAVQLFHPDHLPPKLAHLAAEQREIFSAVKEAYDILSDEERRRSYLSTGLARAKGSPGASPSAPRTDDAKIAAFRAENLLQKCDYATAADAFRTAYEIGHNGDHLAAAAWCVIVDPSRKGETEAARAQLVEAASQHPEAERPSYYLGVLARMEGRVDEALELFRNVLRVNPKHLEAGQELRLLSLRKKHHSGSGSGKR